MESLEEILHVAYEAGASDIHLTVGIPPTMRLNGHLVKMDWSLSCQRIQAAWCDRACTPYYH